MNATLKYATTSEKKLELIAKLVRGKNVVESINLLDNVPNKAAKILLKTIKSAKANAGDANWLYISQINVGRGPKIKRYLPVSRGRGHPIIKHRAFLSIKLDVR